jgi:hypothetical protein
MSINYLSFETLVRYLLLVAITLMISQFSGYVGLANRTCAQHLVCASWRKRWHFGRLVCGRCVVRIPTVTSTVFNFPGSAHVLQVNSWRVPGLCPLPFPSTSFSVHHSLIILPRWGSSHIFTVLTFVPRAAASWYCQSSIYSTTDALVSCLKK